eukprot:scaffold233_cov548-Prasinococcus_capsulatus_cf.AAC.5
MRRKSNVRMLRESVRRARRKRLHKRRGARVCARARCRLRLLGHAQGHQYARGRLLRRLGCLGLLLRVPFFGRPLANPLLAGLLGGARVGTLLLGPGRELVVFLAIGRRRRAADTIGKTFVVDLLGHHLHRNGSVGNYSDSATWKTATQSRGRDKEVGGRRGERVHEAPTYPRLAAILVATEHSVEVRAESAWIEHHAAVRPTHRRGYP